MTHSSHDTGALLVRADASPTIGTGHVMRCLALAQAWQSADGEAHFATVSMPSTLEQRLHSEGMRVHRLAASPGSFADAAQTHAVAQRLEACWTVIDGYPFGTTYQQELQSANYRTLFIDDYGQADRYGADVVLNQNSYADEKLYAVRESYTQLLLGTRYALLRREFWGWRGWKRAIRQRANRVLVTLGGSDPYNTTQQVIRALQQLQQDLEITVVIGGANPHRVALEQQIQQTPGRFTLLAAVSDMSQLITWADVVISAAGSTCWELALLGAPTIAITLAPNQELIARALAARNVVIDQGWHTALQEHALAETVAMLLDQPELRIHMRDSGQALVDGRGVERVMEVLRARAVVCK